MIYALKFLKGTKEDFEKNVYDFEAFDAYRDEVEKIIRKRQLNASKDWKAFGEKLSGKSIPDFDVNLYQEEYMMAEKTKKDDTHLGKFFNAAIRQKSMVTGKVFESGNLLCGWFNLKIKRRH